MKEEYVVIANTLFHVLLFVYCLMRYTKWNMSTVLAFFYALSSIASLAYFENPLYPLFPSAGGIITIQAGLVLWFIDGCCILAFSRIDFTRIKQLIHYDKKLLYNIEKLIVFILAVYLLLALPLSVKDFVSSSNLSEMRNSQYDATQITAKYSGALGFIFYKFQLYVYTTPLLLLSIISVRYVFQKRLTTWDKMGIALYLLAKINIVLCNVSRATIMFATFDLIVLFVLYKDFFAEKVKRKLMLISLSLAIGISFVFAAISFSRFGEEKSLIEDVNTMRYAGEANLNFMSLLYPDLKEPFWGYEDFALFRDILGQDYTSTASREGTTVYNYDIKKKYKYYNPTYIFHGTAGLFLFNFGVFGGIVGAFSFFLFIRRIGKNQSKLPVISIFVIIVCAANILKGICYMEIKGLEGNNLILYLILLSLFLRNSNNRLIVNSNKLNNKYGKK